MTEKNVWEWICMKNNKLFTILLMVALLVFTTACTKDEPEETVSEPDQNETQQIVEENYADEEFLNDFVKALVAAYLPCIPLMPRYLGLEESIAVSPIMENAAKASVFSAKGSINSAQLPFITPPPQ